MFFKNYSTKVMSRISSLMRLLKSFELKLKICISNHIFGDE